MNKFTASVIIISLGLSVSACGKKKVETLPPAPGAELPVDNQNGSTVQPGSQADFLQQMAGRDVIYFDTDRFNIDAADAEALQSQAQWLLRYPNKMVRIEGHADERGTRDYNLALGERRANSAKNYLVSLGVAPSRLTVISYGKERPAAMGSNESAWAQNRRAVTVAID